MKTPRKLSTTTSTQIAQMCATLHVQLNGIHFKDELPAKIQPGCYVVNMQSEMPGTHWVAIIACPMHCAYVDSYGQPPPIEVQTFIQSRYKTWYCNVRQIQAVESDACGYYCVAAMGYYSNYCKGCSDFFKCIDTFLHLFGNDDQSKNDTMLKTVLAQL